ncbi:unnamed protein product [Brassicogethes aeneus]|uniref:Carboxylic ester hydrolase n=1 Tax=Brassicogethes aeneus TaxID=1431903 RepID=A0A9P0BHT6_BRAAE|nr:unnamed protein product [Brassicogethes aeneus]
MSKLFVILVFCDFVIFGNFEIISAVNKKNILQVKTENGVLQGKMNYGKNNESTFYSYQGIPFGKPPIDDLRFRAPKPYGNWSGILDATKEQSGCVEVLIRNYTKVQGMEDCLFLNIFTPENPNKVKTLLPVFFWIYGGAYLEGNTHFDRWGPDILLKEDIIVVTSNYRIGIFGFLSTNNMDSPGNYGLKDQNLALQWVNNNIKYFGGDPNNITLAGQSAGSASVLYHVQSKLSRGLFHKAIAQSGSSLCSWSLQIDPLEITYQIAYALGMNTKNTTEIVARLRKATVDEITGAQQMTTILNFIEFRKIGLAYSPTLEPNHPNAFLTKYSYEALRSGDFNRVPVVLGTTSQESLLFKQFMILLRPAVSLLYDSSPGMMAMPNLNTNSLAKNRQFGLEVMRRYFKQGQLSQSTFDQYANFVTDDAFLRPIRKTMQLLSKFVPVYFYVFTYEGKYIAEGLEGFKTRGALDKGVSHSEDLWYMWSHKNLPEKKGDDLVMSKRLTRMWGNFVKYSNPTPFEEPLLNNTIWPLAQPNNLVQLNINLDLTIESDYRNDYVRFWEYLYRKYGKRPFKTY